MAAYTALVCALWLITRARPAQASGAVGTGTPASCTEAALDAALAGGGLVTFDCGPDPVTITVTSEKATTADTSIDGGGRITLSGRGAVRVFSQPTEQTSGADAQRNGGRHDTLERFETS